MPPILTTTIEPLHDLRYTEQREIFTTMDDESLLINRQKFTKALHDTRFVDHWPAMQLSKQLCEDELKNRGVIITDKIN
jgi:actin-related protein